MADCRYLSLLALALFGLRRVIHGHRDGAPMSACNTMMPNPSPVTGHGAAPSTDDSPFRIHIFDQRHQLLTDYNPQLSNQALRVEIDGPNFKGFQLQARSVVRPGKRVGEFVSPLPEGTEFLRCDGGSPTAVTHANSQWKQNLRFYWRPPSHNVGPIQFLATMVRSRQKYWTLIRSHPLHPYSRNLTVNTRNCGKGFGCFHLGRRGCRRQTNCNYTISWLCHKDSVTFEILGTRNAADAHQGSYAGIGFSLDRKLEEDEMIACKIVEKDLGPGLGNYLIPKNEDKDILPKKGPRLVPLKMLAEKDAFYCRFLRKDLKDPSSALIGYHFFLYGAIYRDGRFSQGTRLPFSNRLPMRLCSHPDIFVELNTARLDRTTFLTFPLACFLILCTSNRRF